MKRVTPSKSTASRKLLFTRAWGRGRVVTTRYGPCVLSGHGAEAGTWEPPELPGVGAVDAVPGGVSGRTCSGVRGVSGPAAPRVDGAGPGRVVGAVASTLGVGAESGAGAGGVLAADSRAWASVAVTAVVDTGAADGRVGSGVVSARVGVGPLVVPAPGRAVDVRTVGPRVDTSSARGLVGGAGLATGGPRVPVGALALAVGPAVVRATVADVAGAVVLGGGLTLGAGAGAAPGAVAEDGVRRVDAAEAGEGPPEAAGPAVSVLNVLPAVTAGELGSAPRVPVVSVTGGVSTVIVPDVSLRTLTAAVTEAFLAEVAVWLETRCP